VNIEISPLQVVMLGEFLVPPRRPSGAKFSGQIQIAFIEKGLTLRGLARRLGISPTLLSFILAGKHVGHKHRPKIARALGLSVKELFGENGAATRRAA